MKSKFIFIFLLLALVLPVSGKRRFVPIISSGPPVFVTGVTQFASLRNNYDDYVGFKFTVGASNITVKTVGRWVVSGNSGTHDVAIFNTSGTILGMATVNTSGKPAGAFAYATLSPSITLSASTDYYIMSFEFVGGDQWYDLGTTTKTTVTTTSVASLLGASYVSAGVVIDVSPLTANTTWVPVNFGY